MTRFIVALLLVLAACTGDEQLGDQCQATTDCATGLVCCGQCDAGTDAGPPAGGCLIDADCDASYCVDGKCDSTGTCTYLPGIAIGR